MTEKTPEQLAGDIAWEMGAARNGRTAGIIAAAIREAVAAEREACAAVALYFGDRRGPRISKTGGEIAEAIRARAARA